MPNSKAQIDYVSQTGPPRRIGKQIKKIPLLQEDYLLQYSFSTAGFAFLIPNSGGISRRNSKYRTNW